MSGPTPSRDPLSGRLPLVAAPMAGGPSTPDLVAAVWEAGGFGLLAGGLKGVDALAGEMADLRGRGIAFGVNLFVPHTAEPMNLEPYRAALQPLADSYGVELGTPDWTVDDHYPAKAELVLREAPAVVSFTFGLPDAALVRALQEAGSQVWVTVTNPAEAIASWTRGADVLVVQGPEAGGHRGTQRPGVPPDRTPLPGLLAMVAAVAPLPLVAAGGVSSGGDVRTLLDAGARAVQLGTLLLRTPESGAHPVHKDMLGRERETVVAQCFSGRWARSLRNRFTDDYAGLAPGAYPQVSQLTAPLRAAAQQRGEVEHMQMWAGTGHRSARPVPAGRVIRDLADAAGLEATGG